MPLGSSAAAAVELTPKPVAFSSDSFGSYADLNSVPVDIVTAGVPGQEMWARFRIQDAGVLWDFAQVITVPSGSPSGTYTLTAYTSSDPAEDGSTITVWSTSGPDFFGNIGVSTDLLPTYWLYVQIVDSGTGVVDRAQLKVMLRHAQQVAIDGVFTGSASIPQGRTRAGVRGPNNVHGRTGVEIVLIATDSITNAPDLNVLTATDGALIQPPLTTETGEPTLVWAAAPFFTWSLTAWVKVFAPAGDYRFHHNPEVDDILIGGFGGSVLGAYTGPPNADYVDLTFLAGGNLATDPVTGAGLAADETFTVASDTWLYIQNAYAGTYDAGGQDSTAAAPFHLSWASLGVPTPAGPDHVVGRTNVVAGVARCFSVGFATVSVAGVAVPPRAIGTPDAVEGSTDVSFPIDTSLAGTPDEVVGGTAVAVATTPDLSDNPPITMAIELTGDLDVLPPPVDELDPPVRWRESPLVVITVPTPIIVGGRPTLPKYVGTLPNTGTLHTGTSHIRAMPPAPTWDGSGYVNPPPSTTNSMVGRWVVDDLPDPGNSFYWLGDPSSSDGTAGISSSKRQWQAHASTPHAPAWHSFYPFKPSVRAVDHYLPGGAIVHHPKGVHFNTDFIEHMWLDWGGPRRQPFTWVLAAMIVSYPTPHYRHYVLDAGRNPDKVGFPRLADWQTGDDRTIKDGLDYRTLLAYSPDHALLRTRTGDHGPGSIVNRSVSNLHPRMLFGVFNGATSYVGDYAAGGKRRRKGRVDHTAAQHHRYYVLGRAQNHMSQDKAAHMLVFEIRYWDYPLTLDELDDQYGQLSSTYKFNKYRRG